MRFLDFFRQLFNRPESSETMNDEVSPQALSEMMTRLEKTQEIEISCDEVLALLDQFAEAHQRGEDVAKMLPLVQHHLEMCLDCQEEFEALLRILQATIDA